MAEMVEPASRVTCWIMNDGKIGTLNQCLGLAEAMARQLTAPSVILDIAIKTMRPRLPWRRLPASWWLFPLRAQAVGGDKLEQPWPDVIISCGRAAAAPAAEIRRRAGGRTVVVAVQDPRISPGKFDLVVVASHDRLRGVAGGNVMVSEGALHRVTSEKLATARQEFAPLLRALPRPLVAVSLGGNNPHFRFGRAEAKDLAGKLVALAKAGYGLAVTPSRRTDPASLAVFRQVLAQSLPPSAYFLWEGSGENPYFGMLAWADHLVVTSDSVSMISEAAATGQPVHVFFLPTGGTGRFLKKIAAILRPQAESGGKFAHFHQNFAELGIIRDLAVASDGLAHWSYPLLSESERAAREVLRLLAARPKMA
ncbi:MAG: mitochondrial fission ELM1 family protein [Candidatus Symbiobacter sp.]|nr:mitochondrial fission ELM1 family protein [Candidatus Symbiobacter sp.]